MLQTDADALNAGATGGQGMGDLRAHDIALGQLNAKGYIQFHPLLAQRLDNFKAAIFLGHALYWSRYLARAQPHRRGWFFMTATQWTDATGLSTREQTAVRTELARHGLIEEALAGRPAVLHYRVNLQATANFLALDSLTWESLNDLMKASLRFYKPLADICGSVSAGLYLSYLLQRQSFALRNPAPQDGAVHLFQGEFLYRPEHARIALCLGIKAQRNAREKLKSAGFIREGRATNEAVPTRVNLAAIASCLQAQERPARKRPNRQLVNAVTLVPAPQPKRPNPAVGSITGLSRSMLPQRQLSLFSATSVPHTSATHTPEPVRHSGVAGQMVASPAANATHLVRSLFAPGWLTRTNQTRSPVPLQTPASHVPPATPVDAAPRLSTGSHPSASSDAFLSTPFCLFVDPKLPFCRNYIKEQGIGKVTTTTTTEPVDNSADATPSRRGSEKQERTTGRAPVPGLAEVKGPVGGVRGIAGGKPEEGAAAPEQSFSAHQSLSIVHPVEVQTPVDQLVLPNQLDTSLHKAVLATVATAPQELRQVFLDELAGHLSIPGKVIHNAPGWLHGLIRNHRDGHVVLAMAPQVAAQRQRLQRHQERIANAASVGRRDSPPQSTSVSPLKADQAVEPYTPTDVQRSAVERLNELRREFAMKSVGGGR